MAEEEKLKRKGRPVKNLPMTMEQMLVSNEERKPKKASRREVIEANKDTISALVGDLADRLEESEKYENRISLQDTEAVKDITLRYIRSCQISGVMPTMSGVALAIGIIPENMFRYMRLHKDSETTKWLQKCKTMFGDILGQASLDGAVAPIPAIFTLKANYGWRDDPEPEVQNNDGQEDLSPDAIAAKWQDLPE